MLYKIILRPFLFLFPAETAHYIAMEIFSLSTKIPGMRWVFKKIYSCDDQSLAREVCGLYFKNPVGLAAGFDKDGKYLDIIDLLGFGFVEIGTVTPRPQSGNPKPRLFRLKKDESIINRMGFNNEGVDALVNRLKNYKKKNVIIGGNIGKNKDTPNEKAKDDYIYCFEKLFPYVDYFVVNISSPNTPGLRALQEKEPLRELLVSLQELNYSKPNVKPIFLKIAPDLSAEQISEIVDICRSTSMSGIVATNTTIYRTGLQTPQHVIDNIGAGGLSGKAIRTKSLEVLAELSGCIYENELILIAVGGIHDAESALERFRHGASLIQVYSGLIFEGPGLVKTICHAIKTNNT